MLKAERTINEDCTGGEYIDGLKMIFDYEIDIETPISLSFSIESSPDIMATIEAIKQQFSGTLTFGNVSVEDGEYRIMVKKDFTFDLLEALSHQIDIVDGCEYFKGISSTDRSFSHVLSSMTTDGSKWIIGDIDMHISDDVLQLEIETEGVNDMPRLVQEAKQYLVEHYDIYVDKSEFKGSNIGFDINPRAMFMSSLEKIHKGVDFVNLTSFIK